MSRLLKMHERRYPSLAKWLQSDLPQVHTNQTVWNALLKFAQLTDRDARDAVKPDTAPIIFVEDLPGAFGLFNKGRPELISLDTDLVGEFEVKPQDATLLQTIEATTLHELIHWSWARAGKTERPRVGGLDLGDQFEEMAYGNANIVKEAATQIEVDDENLGRLSRAYESNGKPGAIGRDTNGGWSYGLYQLSSRQGTLANFLGFLSRESARRPVYDTYVRALTAAGGDVAARQGTTTFHKAWRELANENDFSVAQHDFIKETHYDKFVAKLRTDGIDIGPRSGALKDVAWSVSVQHGPDRTVIFKRPWDSSSPAGRLDDAQFINGIYHERSRVDVYFASSNAKERAAVLNRFQDERVRALEMLRTA